MIIPLLTLLAALRRANAAECVCTGDNTGIPNESPQQGTDFGEKCWPWDDKYDLCLQDNAPAWCRDSWCYVEEGCTVDGVVTAFPSTYEDSGLFYSYEVCGNANQFEGTTEGFRYEWEECPPRTQPLEIYFAVDTSGSIDEEEWYNMRFFLSNLVHYGMNHTDDQVGITSWSQKFYEEFTFATPIPQLVTEIFDMVQKKGQTYTDDAIKHAITQMKKETFNDEAKKTLILITDGEPDPKHGPCDDGDTSVKQRLADEGITFGVLAIDGRNKKDFKGRLGCLVNDPQTDIVIMDNFYSFYQYRDPTGGDMCVNPAFFTPPDPTQAPTMAPSPMPTKKPTEKPSPSPTPKPTDKPTKMPTKMPSKEPSPSPTKKPTEKPSPAPSPKPTKKPTGIPSPSPSPGPTKKPTEKPSPKPTKRPTEMPSPSPSPKPTKRPTGDPTPMPSPKPTMKPSREPSPSPTRKPTFKPTAAPSPKPTKRPTGDPTPAPSPKPTMRPTFKPTAAPSRKPTKRPTGDPTPMPSPKPTKKPSFEPTKKPTPMPSFGPSPSPTRMPTPKPTSMPTPKPTVRPTYKPSFGPTPAPSPKPTDKPTYIPTLKPTYMPTPRPSYKPTPRPSFMPTFRPTYKPTPRPTMMPSRKPTYMPTDRPTYLPSLKPTYEPTDKPTSKPTPMPVTPRPTECVPKEEAKVPAKNRCPKKRRSNTCKKCEECVWADVTCIHQNSGGEVCEHIVHEATCVDLRNCEWNMGRCSRMSPHMKTRRWLNTQGPHFWQTCAENYCNAHTWYGGLRQCHYEPEYGCGCIGLEEDECNANIECNFRNCECKEKQQCHKLGFDECLADERCAVYDGGCTRKCKLAPNQEVPDNVTLMMDHTTGKCKLHTVFKCAETCQAD